MTFDIVIVTFKREVLLEKCLSSIYASLPCELIKIILVNNGDKDISHLEQVKNERVFLISTDNLSPGEARNEGIKLVESEYILFLDDDTTVPEDYFSIALKLLSSHDPSVLGGPDQTCLNPTSFQRSLGFALTSPLTTGPTRLRHTRGDGSKLLVGTEINLILCHLWFKSSLFTDDNFIFNKRYFRNEENILLEELGGAEKKIIYSSELFVYHYRKDNLFEISRVTFLSGFFRKKSFVNGDSKLKPLFFVPSLTMFGIAFLLMCNVKFLAAFSVLFVVSSLFFYLIFSKAKLMETFYALIIQLFMNFSFALGFFTPLALEARLLTKK